MKRAYGSEPVLLHTSPVSPLLEPQKKRQRSKKIVLLGICCSILLVGLVGGWFAWQSLKTPTGIPSSVREAVSFPLYQPRDMPEGFKIDENSFRATEGLVTFSITDDQNHRLVVTEQAKPESFDFASFHEQIENKKDIDTFIGSGAIGIFEDADFASIVAPKTWILVRAPYGIEPGKFTQVLQSFR